MLCENLPQLGVGVLGTGEYGAHASMRRVEEGDLTASLGMDQRREESRLGVGKSESEVLDMVTYTSEC